jgi:hypothetical protein
MTIRIDRHLLDNRQILVDSWNFAVQLGFRVGTCDCGCPAMGQTIPDAPGLRWATLSCPECGEVAYPVRRERVPA